MRRRDPSPVFRPAVRRRVAPPRCVFSSPLRLLASTGSQPCGALPRPFAVRSVPRRTAPRDGTMPWRKHCQTAWTGGRRVLCLCWGTVHSHPKGKEQPTATKKERSQVGTPDATENKKRNADGADTRKREQREMCDRTPSSAVNARRDCVPAARRTGALRTSLKS
jgi:hypothetical protein